MDIHDYLQQLEQQLKEQDSIYHDVAVRYKLSDTAMWILYMVSENNGGYTQQDLVRMCSFPKQTINSALTNLIKNGYARLEAVPNTRNSKNIILTEKGEELVRGTVDNLKAAEAAAFGNFTEDELKIFLDINSRITIYLRTEVEKMFENNGGNNE